MSYVDCPAWQYEKELIWSGGKSMGDEREAEAQTERVLRDDMTGFQYGDISWLPVIDEAAQAAVRDMSATGRAYVVTDE